MDQLKLKSDEFILLLVSQSISKAIETRVKEITENVCLVNSIEELSSLIQNERILTRQNAVYVQLDDLSEANLSDLFCKILNILKTGGFLVMNESKVNLSDVELSLKIAGFVSVEIKKNENGNIITANKPNYEVGSVTKLNLKRTEKKQVWKLDDDDADDQIDPDNLLDEDDLKKPDPASLRVCGTTGKRKACKDCSCGLADELAAEAGDTKVDTTNAPKSSCGSCYLGDAFRCASCPYLGMPAFKPGEKVALSGNLLQDDI